MSPQIASGRLLSTPSVDPSLLELTLVTAKKSETARAGPWILSTTVVKPFARYEGISGFGRRQTRAGQSGGVQTPRALRASETAGFAHRQLALSATRGPDFRQPGGAS